MTEEELRERFRAMGEEALQARQPAPTVPGMPAPQGAPQAPQRATPPMMQSAKTAAMGNPVSQGLVSAGLSGVEHVLGAGDWLQGKMEGTPGTAKNDFQQFTASLRSGMKEEGDNYDRGRVGGNGLAGWMDAGEGSPEMGRKVGDVVGPIAVDAAVGGAAVSGLAKGMSALRPVASSASKMGQYFDRAREMLANAAPAMRNFGGGSAPPLPGMGKVANAIARPAVGAVAGATAAAVTNPDNPLPAAGYGALGGAAIGPGMHVAGKGVDWLTEAGSRLLSKNRVPQIAAELLQKEAGPQAGAIAQRLQTAQPVVPQLPAQIANDPGMARVHAFLRGHGTYGNETGRFVNDQATQIASKVGSLSDDLPAAKAAYDDAVGPLAEKLSADTTRVSNREPLNYLRQFFSVPGKERTDVGKAVVNEARHLGYPSSRLQRPAAGTNFERVKDLNEKLRPGFVMDGGNEMSPRAAAALRGFKESLQESLRTADPTKSNTKALFDAYEAAIASTAPRKNELEILRGIYEKSLESTLTNGAQALSPAKFGKAIDKLLPKVREQLSPASQDLLNQIRGELNANVSGLQGAGGAVAENLRELVLPKAAAAATRAPRGWIGGIIRSGADAVSGSQTARVTEALAEMMKDPAKANTIANLLLQVQAAPRVGNYGRNPALLFSAMQGDDR